MSAFVQQQLHGKLDLVVRDLGEYKVKNITRAIHVFGLDAVEIDAASSVVPAGPPAAARTRWWPLMGVAAFLAVGVAAATAVLFGSAAREVVPGICTDEMSVGVDGPAASRAKAWLSTSEPEGPSHEP